MDCERKRTKSLGEVGLSVDIYVCFLRVFRILVSVTIQGVAHWDRKRFNFHLFATLKKYVREGIQFLEYFKNHKSKSFKRFPEMSGAFCRIFQYCLKRCQNKSTHLRTLHYLLVH